MAGIALTARMAITKAISIGTYASR